MLDCPVGMTPHAAVAIRQKTGINWLVVNLLFYMVQDLSMFSRSLHRSRTGDLDEHVP